MLLLLLVCAIGVVYFVIDFHKRRNKSYATVTDNVPPVSPSFKWNEAKTLIIRPFVGKKNFNPNMGVRNISKTPEDWLLLEDTYKHVTTIKKQLTEDFTDKTVFANNDKRTTLAVQEFYTKVTTFLCQRYPQYFIKKGNEIHNLIHKVTIPVDPRKEKPLNLLKLLSGTIEEDVVILIKDDPDNKDDEYINRAAITAFPAGFDPSEGFNKPISYIHRPVPQYESRLKNSMARFFNHLGPKDLWVRTNWSVQTHKNHFAIAGNHAYDGDLKPLAVEDIDFDSACFLRCERQVLTRLPRSRAFIMTIRTYLTLVKQIKEEGLAEDMITGIDSLPDDLAFYKRRGAWGEAVKEYLRS